MTVEYSVELDGHTLTGAEVSWEAERLHNQGTHPFTHGETLYTIRLDRFRIKGATAATSSLRTALASFLTATLHKLAVPTYLKITDGTTPISQIGNINPADTSDSGNIWEELEVVSHGLPYAIEQLKAGAEFSLVVRCRRLWPDSNGIVRLAKTYASETGPDGLERRTLRCVVKVTIRSGASPSTAAIVSECRVAKPVGWVRSIGNNASGFDVTYPKWPRTDEFETVSQVQRLGNGYAAPTGAGDAHQSETRREDTRTGLTRVTTAAESVGATDGEGFLGGRQPTDSTGETTIDDVRKTARGEWSTLEPTSGYLKGKTTRVAVRRSLRSGGPAVKSYERSGGYLPENRTGAVVGWRLTEEVTAWALGVTAPADFPTAPPPDGPWLFDPEASTESLPEIEDRGAVPGQHLWTRTSRREWLWDGETPPLDDEEVKAMLVRRYEKGEPGLVLS